MTLIDCSSGASLIVVVPPARDADEVMDFLTRLGGMTPYDAKQKLLRGVPFLLEGGATAHDWASHLREAGLEARAVTDEAAALPRLYDVASFSLSNDALGAVGFTGDAFMVPWGAVELVLRARKDPPAPKPMQPAVKGTDHEVLYVLAGDAFLRFELGVVDYAGLGERRTGVVRQNHLALVAAIEAAASGAVKDARLEVLAGKLPPLPRGAAAQGRLGVDGVEGAFHEAAVLLCMAERARRLS